MNWVFNFIDFNKDVDGLILVLLGCFVFNELVLLLCILCGIVELLICYGIELLGVNVCVVGCGMMVGCLFGLLLICCFENCIVILCYIGICNFVEYIWQVDIIIGVVGLLGFINVDMICEGVVFVDVGVLWIFEGKIQGDFIVDVWEKVVWVFLNFGGVGLMICVMLLFNVVDWVEWFIVDFL